MVYVSQKFHFSVFLSIPPLIVIIYRSDPVQLHLLYVQTRDTVTGGGMPCQRQEAVELAGLQCQVRDAPNTPKYTLLLTETHS